MKNLLLFSLCSILFLTSCGDKGKQEQESYTLHYGETKQLHIPADNSGNSWSSSNEFVASVSSSGLVKANHVGTAIINGSDAPVTINVKPVYNLYTEPSTNWGTLSKYIKKAYGTPDVEENGQILYLSTDGSALGTIYIFENDKLCASSVALGNPDMSKLNMFLLERYEAVYVDPESSSVLYIDAATIGECRTMISTGNNNEIGLVVVYMDKNYATTPKSQEVYPNPVNNIYSDTIWRYLNN